MLGTCTKSPATSGFDERRRPTANIENDSTAPAKGPASDMSTCVLLSGRIDLNYTTHTHGSSFRCIPKYINRLQSNWHVLARVMYNSKK